jgi:hypothetical protein
MVAAAAPPNREYVPAVVSATLVIFKQLSSANLCFSVSSNVIGSGTGLNPDSIGSVDLDPDSRQAKIILFCHILTKSNYFYYINFLSSVWIRIEGSEFSKKPES